MTECLICKSKNTKKYKSHFSRFLCARVFNNIDKDINFIHCNECGFSFYDYRLSDEEAQLLYKNYRDKTYQQLRQKYESWYTEEINNLISSNPVDIERRRKSTEKIFTKFFDTSKIKTVLDYAGDKGQFIQSCFNNAQKFVYEISKVEPIDGVIRIDNFSKYSNFDFIMCCNLLEHVSNPYKNMEEIYNLLNPNGYLYIELPFDSPMYSNKLDLLQFLFNKHFSIKTLIKQFLEQRKEKLFKPMHEHINFYTLKSTEILIKNFNFDIVYSKIKNVKSEFSSGKSIQILAKKFTSH